MLREDDDRLVQRAQGGDTGAFEMIVNRYRTRIYNLAYRMLGDHDRAHDAAQEAFIRAYRGLGTYRAPGRLSSWPGPSHYVGPGLAPALSPSKGLR